MPKNYWVTNHYPLMQYIAKLIEKKTSSTRKNRTRPAGLRPAAWETDSFSSIRMGMLLGSASTKKPPHKTVLQVLIIQEDRPPCKRQTRFLWAFCEKSQLRGVRSTTTISDRQPVLKRRAQLLMPEETTKSVPCRRSWPYRRAFSPTHSPI